MVRTWSLWGRVRRWVVWGESLRSSLKRRRRVDVDSFCYHYFGQVEGPDNTPDAIVYPFVKRLSCNDIILCSIIKITGSFSGVVH